MLEAAWGRLGRAETAVIADLRTCSVFVPPFPRFGAIATVAFDRIGNGKCTVSGRTWRPGSQTCRHFDWLLFLVEPLGIVSMRILYYKGDSNYDSLLFADASIAS